MLTIIFSWIVLFFLIFWIGKLFLVPKFLRFLRLKGDFDYFEYFWLGLVVVIGILQVWSIFLPVNFFAAIFVALFGVFSLIFFGRKIGVPKLNFKFFAYVCLILLVISYFASLPVGWEDTYLYHLNAVKWSNLYPVVPGLTNLHARLGINSSIFLFASMLDNLFLKDRSSHVALSFLSAVLFLEYLSIFLLSKNKPLKLFGLLTLPVFLSGIVQTNQVASLSPDFALVIFVLAISLLVLKGTKESLLVAGLLSFVLVTIKFSGLPFAGLIISYVLFNLKSLVFLLVSGTFLFIPFIIRNIILSGWPFYPAPYFGLKLPWSVPEKDVRGMYTVIKAWAISPGPAWTNSVGLSFWQWFPGWLDRNRGVMELKMFFSGIFLALTIPLAGIVSSDFFKKYKGILFLGFTGLAGIFYMLFTAPDFRFGQVFFWIFFASVGTIYFDFSLTKTPSLRWLVIFAGICFLVVSVWPPRIEGPPIWKSVRWEQSFDVRPVLIKPKDGGSPFYVYEPVNKDGLCGNSPLPCTPYPSGNFRERVQGDISKGFLPVH